MILYLRQWHNRLGNNLIQLFNALQLAVYYRCDVVIPKHNFLNKTYIKLNKSNKKKRVKIFTIAKDCFQIKYIPKKTWRCLNHNTHIVKKILLSLFVYNPDRIYTDNDLIIHIRGGDIFDKNGKSVNYVTPPLSYYINIIDNNNYDRIVLISEDVLNPCVNELLSRYPNIEFNIQSFEKDISILMSAINIVESFGTLIPMLCSLSNNIKTIYRPSYQLPCGGIRNKYLQNCKINIVKLNAYYKKQYPWRNMPHQRKYMLTYGMPVEKTHKD